MSNLSRIQSLTIFGLTFLSPVTSVTPHFYSISSTLNLFSQAELCLINLWIYRTYHTYLAFRYFWRNKTLLLTQFFILTYLFTLSLYFLWSSGPWLFPALPITDSLWASHLFLPRWEFSVSHFKYMSTFTLEFSFLLSLYNICLTILEIL